MQQDSLSLTEDSGISESCDDTEEAILTKMKLLAQDLEQKLSLDSNLVQEIAQVSILSMYIYLSLNQQDKREKILRIRKNLGTNLVPEN